MLPLYVLILATELTIRDIKGKVFGVPVWELLGGKVREACPVYGWVGGDRPSDVLAQAKVRKEQGFTRVKMNVCPFIFLSACSLVIHIRSVRSETAE